MKYTLSLIPLVFLSFSPLKKAPAPKDKGMLIYERKMHNCGVDGCYKLDELCQCSSQPIIKIKGTGKGTNRVPFMCKGKDLCTDPIAMKLVNKAWHAIQNNSSDGSIDTLAYTCIYKAKNMHNNTITVYKR